MSVRDLFRAEGVSFFWCRLHDEQVVDFRAGAPGAATSEPIMQDEAYFVIRLSEMYLKTSRILWRRFRPLVHSFCSHSGQHQYNVAGPHQLQLLGDANLDRVVVLNTRLAGPTAFKGGDVELAVGLYSVPADDIAVALVATVAATAELAGLAGAPVTQLTQVVKTGVNAILELGNTKLRLGVQDHFFSSNPLRSGFYVGHQCTPRGRDSPMAARRTPCIRHLSLQHRTVQGA